MAPLIVVLVLLVIFIFLLPNKGDPGKKISPAGVFLIFFAIIVAAFYFFNK